MCFVFILIILIIFFYVNQEALIEKFNDYQTFFPIFPINTYKYPMLNSSGYYIPWSNGYTNLPWWNTSLGNTSNMSYDIRGDPLIIPRTNFAWNNGTTFPIYNQTV